MNDTAQPTLSKPKIKIPATVKAAVLVFLLASSLVIAVLPRLGFQANSTQPSLSILIITGLIVIALNWLLFWYLNRLHLGFGRTALVLGAGYNSVIALIKLVLSPLALYQSNQW